jgi:hypothetical protein
MKGQLLATATNNLSYFKIIEVEWDLVLLGRG